MVLIDQLKSIYIDGELEPVESGAWFAKVARKDYSVGLNLTGNGIDDPDQTFYENYGCGSERNYTHYCNKDLQKLFDEQSQETDVAKRKKLVWDIDKKLQEDVARPILYPRRAPAPAGQPYVKNMTDHDQQRPTTATATRTCGWTSRPCDHPSRRHAAHGSSDRDECRVATSP